MPVKKEPSGRRSVQAEIEVTGSPEGVWQAIASGHFQGQPSELAQLLATSTEATEKAWDLLTQPLGLATARVGEYVTPSRSASSHALQSIDQPCRRRHIAVPFTGE
jgi:hypothetical protein